MITGFLAELGHEFNETLRREGLARRPIQQVNITIRDSVLYKTNLALESATVVKFNAEDSVFSD